MYIHISYLIRVSNQEHDDYVRAFRNNIISNERPKFSRKWLDWRINRAMEFLGINYFAVGEA